MRNALTAFGALVAVALGLVLGCLPASRSHEEMAGTTREALAMSVWTEIPNTGLGGRTGAAIAHDVSRGVTVMFGGVKVLTTNLDELPSSPLAETREWDGKTWSTRIYVDGPKPRVNAAMTYDANANVVLLYGGRGLYDHANNRPVVYADMWSFGVNGWTKLCEPCAPGPRESHAMAFDSKRNVTMLVGGTDRYWTNPGEEAYPTDGPIQTFSNPAMTSTWSWNGASWTERCPARSCTDEPYAVSGGLVYDAKRDKMLFVGGRPWEWFCTGWFTGGGWCDSPTNDRRVPATVRELTVSPLGVVGWSVLCEADVSKLVAGGGKPLPDRNCGASWDQRLGAAVVYDSIRERVVVIGGATRQPAPDGVGKSRGDVLELVFTAGKPEWRSLCPVTNSECGPPRRTNAAAVFEPNRRQIVLAGGGRSELTALSYDDTWTMRVRGDVCTTDATCNGGHCVDGVCCEVAACGTCETCSAVGKEGVCTEIRGADDLDSCHGNRTCSSAPRHGAADAGDAEAPLHVCVGRLGVECREDAECELGHCVDHVCCNVRCDQPCDVCSAALGAPSNGTCGVARAGYEGSPVCLGRRCTGGTNTCEPDAPCGSDTDCQDNYYCAADSKRCKQRVDCGQCAPYRCNADGTCKSRCESVNDCAQGSVCDSDHRCASSPGASDASCSVTTAGASGDSEHGASLALVVVLFVARRRRGAR